jgi:transcriptional regulator with XRE-family HTH domain
MEDFMRKNYGHSRLWGCDDDFNKKIGWELKTRRLAIGLTQSQMADKMQTSQRTVWAIENGIDNLSVTKLIRYLKALGLDGSVKLHFDAGLEGYIMLTSKTNLDIPVGLIYADPKDDAHIPPLPIFDDPFGSGLPPFFRLDSMGLSIAENYKAI